MNAHLSYSTHWRRLGLSALAVVALSGCWEEVHYKPPAGGAAQDSPPTPYVSPYDEPAATDQADTGFAEEVAATPDRLALDEPTAPSSDPASDFGERRPSAGDQPANEVVETPPAPDPARNTRRVAWLLGSKLSLAALANDRAADASEVTKWFDQSRRLADILGVQVDNLPPRPATPDAAANAGIDYLFAEGQRLGRELAAAHGEDHAAAFELAVKSNILLALYRPGAPVSEALVEGIQAAGARTNLPADYFTPLATVVAERGPVSAMRDAVYEMYRRVDEHLSTAQP